MNLRPRSVRLRLTLGYALALATILAAFSVAVYLLVRASLLHEVGERAEQSLAVVQRLVVDGAQDAGEIEEHGIVALFALQHAGAAGFVSTEWRRQGLPEPRSLAAEPRLRRWRAGDGRSYALASATSTAAGQPLTIVVAVDEDPVLEHLRTLALVLLLGFPAAIGAAVIGGSLLAKRLLAPVAAMADAAGRITAERLSERLPIEDPEDEFGRLAGVFNQTLARLQDAFARLQRFTADASHELRTPLTALRSVGEVALRAPDFHERSRETIVSMLEESERLTQLVDGLLMLTRESTEAYRARFAPVDLGQLAGEVVELLRALAEEREQRLETQLEGGVVRGDRGTLRQALVNLVDNAIEYTPRGGSIRVLVQHDRADVAVRVIDTGPGIAEEHRQRVFERFYRVDQGRSRSSGGAGLGLAIARWAAELNGGRIELESTPGKGSMFTLRVPSANHGDPSMKLALLTLVLSLGLASCNSQEEAAPASAPGSIAPAAIELPGGEGGIGLDDLRYSKSLGRVLVPGGRTGKLDLVDPISGTVTSIAGFAAKESYAGGHGDGTTSVDEGAGFLFAIDRTAMQVLVIDPTSRGIVSAAPLAAGPDYVRFVAATRELWVTQPDAEQIEVFRLPDGPRPKPEHVAAIEVKGGPESLVVDGQRGLAYTHLWDGLTVSIDVRDRSIQSRWPNGCAGSRGIALDEQHGWLFVGCAEGRAVVLDVDHGGRQVSNVPTGAGVDIIDYDAQRGHLYVPGGKSATLTILGVSPQGLLGVLGSFPVAQGSHCVTSDGNGRVFVGDPAGGRLLVIVDPFPTSKP